MEEPNAAIRWTIFVFGGGDAAIASSLVIAVIAVMALRRGRSRPFSPVLFAMAIVIYVLLITCSSPIVPMWFVVATSIWLFCILRELAQRSTEFAAHSSRSAISIPQKSPRALFLSSFVWFFTLLAIQAPHLFWFPSTQPISTLLVIGDSITAGLNDNEDTWPRKLSHIVVADVCDASQPGATLQSARKQNLLFADRTGLVILEIGGNDMLEGLPVKRFEQDLEQLLLDVAGPGRTVVMFELPLPPMSAAYGAAQRRQAARHDVKLVPKRLFANLLTTKGATVDGIHLSKPGQTQMADLIHGLFRSQLTSGTGTYQRLERSQL